MTISSRFAVAVHILTLLETGRGVVALRYQQEDL